jgi:DICT domain-containing protein
MTRPSDVPRSPADRPADDATWFDALLAALLAQLERAHRGDLDATAAAIVRANFLLEEARRGRQALDPAARARLLAAHREAALALAQQREELVADLARLRRGRRTLHAYGKSEI